MYDDFPTALKALAEEIGKRKFDPKRYIIVLTPDKYTLHVEKALFKGGGAIDCEVLTLSRLCRRVLGSRKVLSREGGVMLVARAVSAVKDGLTYYKHAAGYYDFAREVYETLLQMSASQFDPSAETEIADGVTLEKLHDLALIKTEYDRLKTECLDASDRLEELISAAKDSPLITNSDFYAIGYANATKLNKAVFDALATVARSFDFFDALPARPTKGKTRVYKMPDSVAGYKLAASIICERVKSAVHIDYEDISVVCPEPRVIARVFREHGIPFYADESVSLDKTPPVALIAALCRLRRGISTADVVSLCKNPFSGCDDRDAELLMCYLAERGIEYGAKSDGVTDSGAKRALERAERIIKVFSAGDDFIRSVRDVIELCDFERVASDIFSDKTDMLTPLETVLTLIEQYGTHSFEVDSNIFLSTVRAVSVKSVPQKRGRVTVSDAATFRLTASKLLIVTDFNEGVLPQTTADGGLLGDAELNELAGAVEPTACEQNRRSRNELAAVMCNAAETICMYGTAGGGRRATFLSEFTDGDIDYAVECRTLKAGYRAANRAEYDRLLARHTVTVPAARETAARGLTPYSASIYAAVGNGDCIAPPFVPEVNNAACESVSVSELTHWFDCPYKRFLLDSVGVAERKRARSAADFGLVMHAFMKKFVETEPLDCSREAVERVMREALVEAKLFDDKSAVEAVIADERIMRDACDYAAANKHVIEAGGYVPTLSEFAFGGKIKLGETGASFNGIIDRVDFCGNRARIIDYKTGNKKFDEDACRSGRDMQLPLYAAALRETGADVTGMFYVPLGGLYDNTDRRLSGCMIGDVSVAEEYDEKLTDGSASDVVHAKFTMKNGTPTGFNGNVSTSVRDREEFDVLIDDCVKTAGRAVDEIASGYIERAPADGACGYCPFVGLCADKKCRS